MYSSSVLSAAWVVGLSAAAALPVTSQPSAIVSGYTNADAGFPQTPSPLSGVPTSFGKNSPVEAINTAPPKPGQSGAAPPRVVSELTGPTSHGPYKGPAPTTMGPLANSPLASTIPALGPNPTATYYNPQGVLLNQQPAIGVPKGMLRVSVDLAPIQTNNLRWSGNEWHASKIYGRERL
jgi:hypothetical protein